MKIERRENRAFFALREEKREKESLKMKEN